MTTQRIEVAVRWATAEDRPTFRDVVLRTGLAAYVPQIFSREEIIGISTGTLPAQLSWSDGRSENVGLLVAEVDGKLVGGARVERRTDGDGELRAVNVLPEYQGRGVGIALWEAALAALRQRGIPALQVWTCTRADWSRRFYEHRGATPFATGEVIIGEHHEPHTGYRILL
jgi:GNAT superfamily N-acetyltransferase